VGIHIFARGPSVLTANYLIRPADVWVRSGALVKPDSSQPLAGVLDARGLAEIHQKAAETVARQHRLRWPVPVVAWPSDTAIGEIPP
jgi:hypothetical protein